MLEFLISSAARRKTLIYLLNNQGKEFHLRELSRNIGKPAPVLKRELDRLDQIGFILSWMEGNRRRFKVNKNFFFLPELKSLVDKSASLSNVLRVGQTLPLEEMFKRRKTWEKRSRKIREDYGENPKHQRPRHPAERRLLDKLS